jgi:hypothetical protein
LCFVTDVEVHHKTSKEVDSRDITSLLESFLLDLQKIPKNYRVNNYSKLIEELESVKIFIRIEIFYAEIFLFRTK